LSIYEQLDLVLAWEASNEDAWLIHS